MEKKIDDREKFNVKLRNKFLKKDTNVCFIVSTCKLKDSRVK